MYVCCFLATTTTSPITTIDLLFPTLIFKAGSTKFKNIFVENKKKGFDFYVFCFFISRPYSSLVLPMVPNTGATYGGYPEPTYF